jgi:hypothetical protein
MLAAFLQTAPQLAKQVAPQVYVTVQQPAGMPEWVKIFISAAVGAFLCNRLQYRNGVHEAVYRTTGNHSPIDKRDVAICE